ncbi:MAG: hypothetical protein LAO77_07655 [Acidobacteriia bacterium]|nr:hypothetical protein [Terriglobia bacterium]
MSDRPKAPFTELLTKLVRVPKREIDKEEQKYQEEREELRQQRAKPVHHPRPSSH